MTTGEQIDYDLVTAISTAPVQASPLLPADPFESIWTSTLETLPVPESTPSSSHSSIHGASPGSRGAISKKRSKDRQRNTEAARRYRQRRVDETESLRQSLAAVTKERDELQLKLVRIEAEAALLRDLVGHGSNARS